ncbi:ATP-binding protein [Actinomadura rudentiformis]|nr:ATP-binding protein [Actinomadura rudentiformis]
MTCIAAGTVAAEVRRRIELRLADWRLPHIAADTFVIADELIVNACTETPEGEIRVWFTRQPGAVLLAVWDSSDAMPQARPVVELEPEDLDLSPQNFDNNGGWGLPLVLALASECGTTRTRPHGKWVWARITY